MENLENLKNLESTNENPECCRRSFGASIKDTAARLLADPTIAPRQVAKDRLAICESNVCGAFNERGSTCERCGCYMPLKTTMANMRCPIDHWTEWMRAVSIPEADSQ
jgi:hypothetical protein